MSDVVAFEFWSSAEANRLLARLSPMWRGRIDLEGHVWVLVVELHPDDGDLAALLRGVERSIGVWGLRAIRYHLDGRAYVLEACDSLVEAPVG